LVGIEYVGYDSPPRNYEIPGSRITKIFNSIGAGANYAFIFNTGILPEIQVFKVIFFSIY
jgi:hypothetical protein